MYHFKKISVSVLFKGRGRGATLAVMGAELMPSRNLIPSLCKNSAVTIYSYTGAICRDKCDAMCHGDNCRPPRLESQSRTQHTSFFLLSARRVKGDIKINPNDLIFAS